MPAAISPPQIAVTENHFASQPNRCGQVRRLRLRFFDLAGVLRVPPAFCDPPDRDVRFEATGLAEGPRVGLRDVLRVGRRFPGDDIRRRVGPPVLLLGGFAMRLK
jgi:hypothetical protein